jgi:hypothetical protein
MTAALRALAAACRDMDYTEAETLEILRKADQPWSRPITRQKRNV